MTFACGLAIIPAMSENTLIIEAAEAVRLASNSKGSTIEFPAIPSESKEDGLGHHLWFLFLFVTCPIWAPPLCALAALASVVTLDTDAMSTPPRFQRGGDQGLINDALFRNDPAIRGDWAMQTDWAVWPR